jgi:hypothetical protein
VEQLYRELGIDLRVMPLEDRLSMLKTLLVSSAWLLVGGDVDGVFSWNSLRDAKIPPLPEDTTYFTCKEHASFKGSLYYLYIDNRRMNYISRKGSYATRGVVSWNDKSMPVWSEWERSDVKEMKCNIKSAAKYGNRIKIGDVLDDTDTEMAVSNDCDDYGESGNNVVSRMDVRTLSSDTDTESSNSSDIDDDEAGANSVAPHWEPEFEDGRSWTIVIATKIWTAAITNRATTKM